MSTTSNISVLQLADFSPEHFLEHYWQRRPLVIRQGFPGFEDPISANELAGLACEDEVESRLIWREKEQWQAASGPFESFEYLGERDWCLIVQAVNHWSPEVAELAQAFAFLPQWRFDDVMISYSTAGGGVGPHIDLYDVFICQGSGRRQWRVGERGNHRQFAAHAALLHTDPFEPIIDVELLPGDILYIPPGFPHDGVTLDESMSFSVGYRGKSASAMLSGLADYVIDQERGETLFSDPGRPMQRHPGQIDGRDFAMIRAQMQALLDDPQLVADFAGSFLSRNKCQLDLQELDERFEAAELLSVLEQQPLLRTGGARCFYVEETQADGVCYLDGERHDFGPACAGAIPLLCDRQQLSFEELGPWLRQSALLEALTGWVNAGYWYFDE